MHDTAPPPLERTGRPGHFIPLRKREILAALKARAGQRERAETLAAVARRLALIFHVEFHGRREALKDLYARFNPDQGGEGPLPDAPKARAEFLDALEEALRAANFRRLGPGEMGGRRDSEGRVRAKVHVPHDVFEEVRFHARGWHRRDIEVRKLFGLMRETVEAEVFHDVVFVAVVRRDLDEKRHRDSRLRPGGVYIKLFRDIPRADLETLYPNARVVMGLTDKLVLGVPAVVGGVPIMINLLPALTVLFVVAGAYLGISGTVEEDAMKQALGALSGLGALGGFLARQWIKYERQKLKYQKQVSDNAYFNNLNNNAAFFDHLIGASEDSEVKEAVLAYAFLAEADGPLDEATLDGRIEAWLRESCEVEVDFEIDDALAKLERFGLVRREGDALRAVDPETARARLDSAWADLTETAFNEAPGA